MNQYRGFTKRVLLLTCLSLGLAVTACTHTRHSSFAGQLPAFDLNEYFEGCVVGWGAIDNWRGEPAVRFKVNINGSVDEDGELTLDEDFLYDDGSRSKRVWRISETSPNYYEGGAADVEGTAAGAVVGNSLRWKYKLRVPRGDSDVVLAVDDWLRLQPDGVLLNYSLLKKFGITVGKVSIAFQQMDAAVCAGVPEVEQWALDTARLQIQSVSSRQVSGADSYSF